MLRARLLLSMENLFTPQDRLKSGYFPQFYHVLVPLGDHHLTQSSSSNDQWSGALKALKGEFRSGLEKSDKEMGKMVKELENEVEKSIQKIESLDKKMEILENMVGQSQLKMKEQILLNQQELVGLLKSFGSGLVIDPVVK